MENSCGLGYAIRIRDFYLSDGLILGSPGFIRDWEDFDARSIDEYFRKSWEIFVERVKRFKNMERPPTAREEKELKFMLEALIDAKKIIKDL